MEKENDKKKGYSVRYPDSSVLQILDVRQGVVEKAGLLMKVELRGSSCSTWALLGLMRKGELSKEVG